MMEQHASPPSEDEGHPIETQTHFHFSLPSDDTARPHKMAKRMLTSVSAQPGKETEDLRALRTYQLACASHEALVAQANYRRLRVREIQMIHTIAQAELEEAEASAQRAETQMNEIRRDLCSSGGPFTEENLDKFAAANQPTPEYPFPGLDAELGVDSYDGGNGSRASSGNHSGVHDE